MTYHCVITFMNGQIPLKDLGSEAFIHHLEKNNIMFSLEKYMVLFFTLKNFNCGKVYPT